MKILLVNDFENAGGCEVVLAQNRELLKNDFVFSCFFGSKEYTKPKSPLEYIYSKKNYASLKDKLISERPDIIHLYNFYHLLSPSILQAIKEYRKVDANVKVIYSAHDFHLLCPSSSFNYFKLFSSKFYSFKPVPSIANLLFKRVDYRGLIFSWLKKVQWILAYGMKNLDKQIDTVITPSVFLQELFKSKFPRKEIILVRNPYQFNVPSFPIAISDKQVFKIVFIGRVEKEKGLLELMDAAAFFDFPFTIDIIGSGNLLALVKLKIESLKLEKKISILPRMEHAALLVKLNSYHAMVLPSLWYENAPLSIVEAAAANLRILASDHGGIKEIANICGGEYLFNPYSVNSINEACKNAYTDWSLGKPLEGRSMNVIEDVFSIGKFKDGLIASYLN